MGGMVPILLVMALAFVTQSVPKSAPPDAPDTTQAVELTDWILPVPACADSLDLEGEDLEF